MEDWRFIQGFEAEYSVSDLGKIRSERYGRLLEPYLANDYLRVRLCTNGNDIQPAVHRLVLITFKGFDFKRPFGNHINGVKTDNRLVNLEWTTASENLVHARRVLHSRFSSKLTRDEVLIIKSLFGTMSQSKIAEKFGVSQMTISKIKTNKAWSNISV